MATKLSRSKIELFLDCPRCFWLDQVKGVKRPSFPAFTLNSAVDHLLKKEFDGHRAEQTSHPLLLRYGLKLIPADRPELTKWRHNFTGVQHHHAPTDLLVYGAIDDLWQDSTGLHYVVDYKATAKTEAPTLDGHWQQAYKRQMEVYQWLLRRNNLKIADTGYFVYVNGRRDAAAFDAKLEFDVALLPYTGSDKWVEPTLPKIRATLESPTTPAASDACEYCTYRTTAAKGEVVAKPTLF